AADLAERLLRGPGEIVLLVEVLAQDVDEHFGVDVALARQRAEAVPQLGVVDDDPAVGPDRAVGDRGLVAVLVRLDSGRERTRWANSPRMRASRPKTTPKIPHMARPNAPPAGRRRRGATAGRAARAGRSGCRGRSLAARAVRPG